MASTKRGTTMTFADDDRDDDFLENDETSSFDEDSDEEATDEESEPTEAGQVSEVVDRLRETLTYDMAAKAYRSRHGADPDDDDLESFMEELVNEHFNAGLDEWNDEYLYYD